MSCLRGRPRFFFSVISNNDNLESLAGLRGLGGLRELSSLVVEGEVAKGSTEKNFIVNATGIHVAMAEPTREDPSQP